MKLDRVLDDVLLYRVPFEILRFDKQSEEYIGECLMRYQPSAAILVEELKLNEIEQAFNVHDVDLTNQAFFQDMLVERIDLSRFDYQLAFYAD